MNIIYFKSEIGNFGDDLNPWLWEKLLGDLSQYNSDYDLVGIGSILDDRLQGERKKVIFGSGVRDFGFNKKEFKNLDFIFVRGPISSKAVGGVPYITDAAYGLRLLPEETVEKKYDLSFVPYFRHVKHFDWSLFEKRTGIHVILPTNSVDVVIKEIRQSKKIISAAMHGAIIADIYRVPWMRVRFSKHGHESALTSELKWSDWSQSIGFESIPFHSFDFNFNGRTPAIKKLLYITIMKRRFRNNQFSLSTTETINAIDSKLKEAIEQFKQTYINA